MNTTRYTYIIVHHTIWAQFRYNSHLIKDLHYVLSSILSHITITKSIYSCYHVYAPCTIQPLSRICALYNTATITYMHLVQYSHYHVYAPCTIQPLSHICVLYHAATIYIVSLKLSVPSHEPQGKRGTYYSE
jgi:hypothetical protein